MEDVKKIARKYVSDSLAEKIAEFVAKATQQLAANVSEENDENINDIQNLSDEDELQNIGRQSLQKGTKTTQHDSKDHIKYVEFEKEYKEDKNILIVNKDISNAGQVINWDKKINEMAYDITNSKQAKNFEQPEADYEQRKNDFKSKPDRGRQRDYEHQNLDKTNNKKSNHYSERQKIEYEQQDLEQKKPALKQHKLAYKKPKTARNRKSHTQNQKKIIKDLRRPIVEAVPEPDKPRSTIRPTIDYTILYHKSLRNGSPDSKGTAQRGHRLTGFDSRESFNQTSQYALRGFNIPKSLTTKPERVEFDQYYDNPNYPKSEFIATSGPVALPKVPMMKPWWEKEMVATKIGFR